MSVYSCEKVAANQNFINEVVGQVPGAHGACIFADSRDMKNGSAYCVRHEKHCEVLDGKQGPCLGTFGCSCKGFRKSTRLAKARTRGLFGEVWHALKGMGMCRAQYALGNALGALCAGGIAPHHRHGGCQQPGQVR